MATPRQWHLYKHGWPRVRKKWRKIMQTVKIQPEKMPEPVSTVLYRSLADAVRRAFADNNTQKEYEAWKQRRYAGKA